MSKIEQSGKSLLKRPKLPIKGGSAPEEEVKEVFMSRSNECHVVFVLNCKTHHAI